MERVAVTSSNIKAIGYDEPTQTAEVEFLSGVVYRYEQVPPEAHAAFVEADSIGRHFAKEFRPKFVGKKVEPPVAAEPAAEEGTR